ncbi:MAG: hypothetical protein K1000chlam3_00276 [Chlamydiae bacterium]|nr:hypothetical protein [Chlamydiota bacterium]
MMPFFTWKNTTKAQDIELHTAHERSQLLGKKKIQKAFEKIDASARRQIGIVAGVLGSFVFLIGILCLTDVIADKKSGIILTTLGSVILCANCIFFACICRK